MAKKTAAAKQQNPDDLPEEYKKGKTRFLGLTIGLSKQVFIPRPETEFWVRAAISDLKKIKHSGVSVLDIFSGSGCAGIAVLRKTNNTRVDFVDADPRAIAQIKENLALNKIDKKRIRVILSDGFRKIAPGTRYAAILANPPYVDPARVSEVQPSVLRYEAHQALFGGRRGMQAIKRFLRAAKKNLDDGGIIYMEFDPRQAEEVLSLAAEEKYGSIRMCRDQFGRIRFAKIFK